MGAREEASAGGGIMSAKPIGYRITFTIPRPPASKKNGRRVFRAGKRIRFMPSRQAELDEDLVSEIARQTCGGQMPFDELDALRIDYSHDVNTDEVQVAVEKIGTLPPAKGKGAGFRGTKRDVIGIGETIADGLQGVLYPNDNAIDAWAIGRRR